VIVDATTIVLHTARNVARTLQVPLSQVLKAVRLGCFSPRARSSSGEMLFHEADVRELAKHRTKAKAISKPTEKP
jgi:hypothetical protein